MTKKIKSIHDPKLKLEILTPENIHKIHDATLEIIEKTGVRFPSKKALEIWEKHGADVDLAVADSNVVVIPDEPLNACQAQANAVLPFVVIYPTDGADVLSHREPARVT